MDRVSYEKGKQRRSASLTRFSLSLSPRTTNTSVFPSSPKSSPKKSSEIRSPRLSPTSVVPIKKIKLLGRGAIGTEVWKVKINGWACCAKIIDTSCCRDTELACFEKEISILQTLPSQNKHIVQYLGFQNAGTRLEIFMTLYDGSLYNIIQDRNLHQLPFTFKAIVGIAYQILSALVVIHSRRLIHRDIKSSNIFYETVFNEKTTYVLGDFGESKIIPKYTNTITGTHRWMAPEILLDEEYSFEADMWSFGMLLYELMSLEIPYHDIKGFGAEKRILEGVLPELTPQQNKDYIELIEIWKDCLIVDPKERLTAARCIFRVQNIIDSF